MASYSSASEWVGTATDMRDRDLARTGVRPCGGDGGRVELNLDGRVGERGDEDEQGVSAFVRI